MAFRHDMARVLVAAAMAGSLFAFPPLLHAGTESVGSATLSSDAYPGVIRLHVDATDTDRGIFHVRQVIPVPSSGRFTLYYPKWLPGNHAPSGPVDKMAGLVIRGGGTVLPWTRDSLDMHNFHVTVPDGVSELELSFQFLSPVDKGQGRIMVTPNIINLQWNTVVLYPAGYEASKIQVEPSVKFPAGFQYGTALRGTAGTDGVQFERVRLDTLVDSPIFAGRHFRRFDLDPGSNVPVTLNVVADRADVIEPDQKQLAIHRNLMTQAYRLFGSKPFDRYDFLLALTSELGRIGLEHHRSSENSHPLNYFTGWSDMPVGRDLLAHELVHAWNGKTWRGRDLATAHFNMPMQDSLLWVYEGQTQYWGYVLSARSGLLSPQDVLDSLAMTAAAYAHQSGREWRSLLDTTNDPIVQQRRPMPWSDWQRREDYYSEGLLVWLDVDTKLRELTNGKRSLDDFARAFFGKDTDGQTVIPYERGDVIATLNGIAAFDWDAFLKARVDDSNAPAPLDGITRGGYRLVYKEEPNTYAARSAKRYRTADFRYSLGFNVSEDNHSLSSVQWNSPAFRAGLKVGTVLVAVNGYAYNTDLLVDAVTVAKASKKSIELLVRNGNYYRTVAIAYYGGLKYPHLERVGDRATLDAILKPR